MPAIYEPPPRRAAPPPAREHADRWRSSVPGAPPWAPAPSRWRWLAIGFVAAYAATMVLPCNFVWFLCAIPHEMGHATVGCLLGHPSAPAISLAGHAWTGIAPLERWLVWTMAIGFAAAAVACRQRRLACVALGATAVLVPLLAFRDLADVLIAVGGHGGELVFAAYCYALAWTGGRTDTPQERVACAMAGALVQCTNLQLCFGLLTSAAARDHYAHSGSLGLKNDYLVLAEDLLQWPLRSVALVMFVAALLPLPIGLLVGHWRERSANRD